MALRASTRVPNRVTPSTSDSTGRLRPPSC
ncbi:hypothetical protein, partial [Frankia sp. Cas8]